LDTLTGSPDNCNVECMHTPITMPHDNDGCCPSGANNNTDKDCAAACGNGIREASEECDGTPDCTADCKLKMSSPPPDHPECTDGSTCTNSCFPVGILSCCTALGTCGCTWAPGAYCF